MKISDTLRVAQAGLWDGTCEWDYDVNSKFSCCAIRYVEGKSKRPVLNFVTNFMESGEQGGGYLRGIANRKYHPSEGVRDASEEEIQGCRFMWLELMILIAEEQGE